MALLLISATLSLAEHNPINSCRVLLVGSVSVAEAARRLGVGVVRVHQRIADGSLPAERVGSQWVIDEASLSSVLESNRAGRPLSERSAWALLAFSQDPHLLDGLASWERARASNRLRQLLAGSGPEDALSEDQVRATAKALRSLLRKRAERRLFRASPRDLPDLRQDDRVVLSGLSHPRSGLASGDLVEGYVAVDGLDGLVNEYLFSRAKAEKGSNVVLHVGSIVPDGDDAMASLLLAADLAEHRRPREEARAAELLREIARQHPEIVAGGRQPGAKPRKDRT